MSKKTIAVLAGISVLFNFLFLIQDPTLRFFAGLGALVGFIAWIGAIRNAWYCKAYGWLVVVIFTYAYGALFYGIFGPGRLPLPAEDEIRRLQATDPQATKWTVSSLNQHLQEYLRKIPGADFDIEENTLRYTLRRFKWPVSG